MPLKELERLQAVERFLKLESSKESELQEIVSMAAKICGCSSALITLIDQDTQHVKFQHAYSGKCSTREDAFCNHVIREGRIIIVPDSMLDPRFASHPSVRSGTGIRFYAGVPLTTVDGHHLGSLCVLDKQVGSLNEQQQDMLHILAKQVIQLMEFDESIALLKAQYAEAKQQEIVLRSFFESSMEQHLLLGLNFEILACNKTWERYALGRYGRKMEKGKSMIDFIHQDHLHEFYKDYTKALRGTSVYDERNLRRNGKDSWWMVKFEPAFGTCGDIIGVSVNVADVSSRVERENMVKKQNEQLREIAFIQSHEFRKPVSSILGLMQLIDMDGRMENMEEWEMMQRAVKELDDKIRGIVSQIF
jgi:PAS domain S-box-containing protein